MRRWMLVLCCAFSMPSFANAQQADAAETRLKAQRDELARIRDERLQRRSLLLGQALSPPPLPEPPAHRSRSLAGIVPYASSTGQEHD